MYTLISSANKYTWTFSFPNYILLISFICFIALANTILNRYREKGIALSCSWLFWVSSHLGWCWLRTCCQLLLWCSGVFLYAWSLQDFYYEVVLDFVKGLFCSQGDNHAFFLSVYAHPPPHEYLYWLSYIDPSMHLQDEAYFIMVNFLFDVFEFNLQIYYWVFFSSVYMSEIDL